MSLKIDVKSFSRAIAIYTFRMNRTDYIGIMGIEETAINHIVLFFWSKS
jgi:hypothetical protein